MTTPMQVRLDDGSGWPHPDYVSELEWRLRYARIGNSSARKALLMAASVCAAYVALITDPSEGQRPMEIRRALRRERALRQGRSDG